MLDVPQLIGEVARRNGIRVEADDPAFALVTLNQLVLEQTARELQEDIRASIAAFDSSIQKVQTRAGHMVAQEFHERAAALRGELQDDIVEAAFKATELLRAVPPAHLRPARTQWMVAGLFLAIVVFWVGFWMGAHCAHI